MFRWTLIILLIVRQGISSRSAEEKRVRRLVRSWAPLVWLAPGENFLPLGVPEFLDNMQTRDSAYLRTRVNVERLLRNRTSFLYGKRPAGRVPVYALIGNCVTPDRSKGMSKKNSSDSSKRRKSSKGQCNDLSILTDDDSQDGADLKNSLDYREEANDDREHEESLIYEEKRSRRPHFHVTYWMFYPFSEGKTMCVLDLGFFGSWPIPMVGRMCHGTFKEYGSHVGDWEHMSLYFKGDEHPIAMYVSAHDAGAFYRYDTRSKTFVYESQETRKGIFQKPTFPERVFTSGGSHPVLFSAKGSHGLWTAPGKHKFVRIPRLYDESGFGTPWPTWKKVELLQLEVKDSMPAWMTFKGKWGNPKSNCHPLARLGINICEFVDGPTGIPTKKLNFQC